MHLVAKVFDLDITEEEILGESEGLIGQESNLAQINALNRLIDRCLLFHQALSTGFSASEDEYDNALLETLEDIEVAPRSEEETRLMEQRILKRIIIRKYVQDMYSRGINIGDDHVLAFYEDQKEVFYAPESVRASHILIRHDEPEAEKKALELRSRIKTAEDFINICGAHSQCPTGVRYGDLGWFPKGRMIKEIEDVAFSLQPGQISEVFSTRYGFHILMVTEEKKKQQVPFEEIKDSLKSRMMQLEREYFLIRHVNDLRDSFRDQIQILDSNYIIKV